MKTRFILSKYSEGVAGTSIWTPVSIHRSRSAAIAQVDFLGGRLAQLGRYSNERTYTIYEVESFE